MTIMKAIAMTALAGTLLAGPGAAIAQPTEHGNSGTAHQNNDSRKAGRDDEKAARGATTGENEATHDQTTAGDYDQDTAAARSDQDEQSDQDSDEEGGAKTGAKTNFGALMSSMHRGGTLADLSGLSSGFTVEQVNISDYEKGNRKAAIENALRNVDQQALQTTLSGNQAVLDALAAKNIDVSTVAYAYVDAGGNLIVYTR